MAKKNSVIRFSAQVWQVKTLVDGGMNVTFSLSEKELKAISQLLECKQRGAIVEIAAVPVKQEIKKFSDEPKRRKERYPYRPNS